MTPLEKLHSMPMPFAQLKGVTFTEADKDRVVARMLVRPDLCTLGHALHGGAIMALADSVGAAATLLNLPEDAKGTTTIESKTNFIGGAREGMTVIATATPVHRGRRTQVWQTRLETEEGKLVAVVTRPRWSSYNYGARRAVRLSSRCRYFRRRRALHLMLQRTISAV